MKHVSLRGPMGPGRTDLRDLIDLEELQRIQDEFAAETGLAMITVDSSGTPVSRASEFSKLCRYLRQDPNIRKLCLTCDAHGGFQGAIQGKPFVYQCHAGLVDFSVPIMLEQSYLGAIMCGQVLLNKGQDELSQLVGLPGEWYETSTVRTMFDEVSVVSFSKLESAADAILRLANQKLGELAGRGAAAKAEAGPFLGRLSAFTGPADDVLAPLLAGAAKPLPLVPMQQSPLEHTQLDATRISRNLHRGALTANLEILTNYLDGLLPRWSQKIKPSTLGPFEDLMIGLATSAGMQQGREVSQTIIHRRNVRRGAMNRYECQVYCERLLMRLHTLVEPDIAVQERTIGSLLNEVEKAPSNFSTVGRAAEYLNWSESHFARKFKEATGTSYNTYVNGRRLERAKLMLVHTTKPVLRIATELGFQPPNYFSRTFRRQVGVTPSQYRASHVEAAS